MKLLQKYSLPLLIVVSIFLLGWIFGQRNGKQRAVEQIHQIINPHYFNKLNQVVGIIEQEYIEPLSSDSIAELAIPAILTKLDPHSAYIPARDFQQVEEPLEGEFDGIGIVFNMATDTVIVLNVIPSGPSQKAGIIAGDRIIKVNDSIIAGRSVPQIKVMKLLRGPRGTKVNLSLERKGIAQPVEVTVTRDAIPLNSVEATMMLTDNIGFIRLSQFAKTSFAEVSSAVDTLRKQGMKALVLDLRGNSGGFLDQAIHIANQFLERGKLIVYTEDRNKKQMRQYSDGRGRATDIEIAVLIDESSASSSEILAGALQDNDRGTIIGRRSFGKGLVQSQVPFADGSAMRLTVAKYFTPTGRSIQKPYTAGDGEGYNMDIINRYNHNEFFSADSIHFADSLRFTTPKGKVVYGGGGIMPDIFIPLDTTDMSRYFLEVSGRNILYRYTIEYADRNRSKLNAAKSLKDIEAMFSADSGMFNGFIDYAAANGVKPNWREISVSRKIMEAQLRAYIARNTEFDSSAFYYFIRPIDNAMLTAIETLQNNLKNNQKR